jgi:hypothetical protein
MTTTAKPVRRETFSSIRERRNVRPIVIELHTTFVRVRPKGMRTFYTVTYDQIYMTGARNQAEERRREKAEAKKARGRVS